MWKNVWRAWGVKHLYFNQARTKEILAMENLDFWQTFHYDLIWTFVTMIAICFLIWLQKKRHVLNFFPAPITASFFGILIMCSFNGDLSSLFPRARVKNKTGRLISREIWAHSFNFSFCNYMGSLPKRTCEYLIQLLQSIPPLNKNI